MALFKKKAPLPGEGIISDVRKGADSAEAEMRVLDAAKQQWLKELGISEDDVSNPRDVERLARYFEAHARAMRKFAQKLADRAVEAEKWSGFMEQAADERRARSRKIK
jgi:hypothetical protein